jgi:alkylation response protein AidB-like acyl-CoA dehydrogenase
VENDAKASRTDPGALRAEVRAWTALNIPENWRSRMTAVNTQEFVAFQKQWLKTLVSGGYAIPHWPAGWPGSGRLLTEQIVIFEELARADAPRLILSFVSLYHTAVTLFEWGSEAQKARHLPAILEGEVWCQGFSEPNAGSDLASLRTRAVRKGDRYIVDGQKIWSTLGHYADHCLLLVRTDSSGRKQAGITYLLLDMKSKGVETRPIRQITGDEEFSEIFLNAVEVPVENRLGEENAGWRVAQTTLSSERGLTVLELSERMHRSLWRLVEAAAPGGAWIEDDQLRREVVDVILQVDELRLLVGRLLQSAVAGKEEVGAASIVKLFYADTLRRFTSLGRRLSTFAGQYWTPFTLGAGHETGNWTFDFMNSYMWSIAGGTNEIQRNIVAERILGMPRERSE